MKILFYLPNANYKDIDYSRLEEGNPGLGGTEYVILITALLLSRKIISQNLEKEFQIHVAAQNPNIDIPGISFVAASDITDVVSMNADYILFKYEKNSYIELTNALQIKKKKDTSIKTKIIVWAHNLIDRKERNIIDKDANVPVVLCVSKEQLNLYRDHHLFLKSTYIYNGIPLGYLKSIKGSLPSYSDRPHEVTSVGCIDYYKGFHLIAKAWKTVLAAVPDAKLNVIGAGNLYDRNSKLGKYGIAEESYENSFMPYLTEKFEENGEIKERILPSVKFWGLMGVEKNNVLIKTRVGVPNPMGKESFCLVALEMQAMGAMLTTKDYGGFRNTVYKTGMLYDNPDDLAKNIILLLQAEDNHIDECYQWMENNFSYESIADQWLQFIVNLHEGNIILGSKKLPYKENRTDYLGWMREINRRIKSIIGYSLPTIEFYRSILRRFGLVKDF